MGLLMTYNESEITLCLTASRLLVLYFTCRPNTFLLTQLLSMFIMFTTPEPRNGYRKRKIIITTLY
jgi:hypothetical protein